MSDMAVIKILQDAVKDAVTQSGTPKLPIKFLDVTFTPPKDEKYLEIVWIPVNNEDYWGDEKNYQGIIRLILHWPKNSTGTYAPLKVIESIEAFFTKGKLLQGVQIYAKSGFTGALDNGTELLYPVSLRYLKYRSA